MTGRAKKPPILATRWDDIQKINEVYQQQIKMRAAKRKGPDDLYSSQLCYVCKGTRSIRDTTGDPRRWNWLECGNCHGFSHKICHKMEIDDIVPPGFMCKACQDFEELEGKRDLH